MKGTFAIAPLLCVIVAGAAAERYRYDPAEPDGKATPTDYRGCGPGARPETGLQGQVPLADQRSGRSAAGYSCNVRRVGQADVGRRGQNFQLAWYRDCAYVSTIGLQAISGKLGEPDPSLDGIAVVDVADPRKPEVSDVVKSKVDKSSHEMLEVNQARGLLVASQGGLIAQYVEVYDVKTNCRHPKFLGRYDAGIPIFHGLKVSEDGKTFYATDTFAATGIGQVMHVVDISDPRHPRRIMTWDPTHERPAVQYAVHDLDVSGNGNRAYLGGAPYQAALGNLGGGAPSVGPTGTSLAIVDTSDIQARRPHPDIRPISRLTLPNLGHTIQRMTVNGRRYLLVSGEAPLGVPTGCPWAWGHIVDVTDERHPTRVSDIRLQVNQQRHCGTTRQDGGAIYSIHYVGVDREVDTRYAFYTYYTGGLRVFDVRDPLHPKEVGYYQPPATPNTKFPALSPVTPDSGSKVFDYSTSVVRYRPETGAIWEVSVNGGFQVLQLTGEPGRQRAALRLPQTRARTALARKRVPVRIRCAQACTATVRVTIQGKRSKRASVRLPVDGARTIRVPLTRTMRTRLRRYPKTRLRAYATVHDRLTGEIQQAVRSRAQALSR